jgi:hypothetical protein
MNVMMAALTAATHTCDEGCSDSSTAEPHFSSNICNDGCSDSCYSCRLPLPLPVMKAVLTAATAVASIPLYM